MEKKIGYSMIKHGYNISVYIQNSAGDTICRMLRDDAPSYAQQESYAKRIVESWNEHDKLKEENALLIATLKTIADCDEKSTGYSLTKSDAKGFVKIAKDMLDNLKNK
jgi:hypothetical protein